MADEPEGIDKIEAAFEEIRSALRPPRRGLAPEVPKPPRPRPDPGPEAPETRFTPKDAIILAYSNPRFMESLLTNPESWADQFGLPHEAVVQLGNIDIAAVRNMGGLVKDPLSFAEAAEVFIDVARGGGVSKPYE